MKRLPNGSVLYDDSPWFIEIVLFLSAVGLGLAGWVGLRQHPPAYFIVAVLVFFAIVCVLGMFAQQQHRTYLFDPSISMMTWTCKGLRSQSSGQVAFKDISVTLDGSSESSGGTIYRLMLATPAGQMPLSRAYDSSLKGAQDQAAALRTLLGETSDSLHDDSVARMSQSGNKTGAVKLLRDQSSMSLDDAVRQVDEHQT